MGKTDLPKISIAQQSAHYVLNMVKITLGQTASKGNMGQVMEVQLSLLPGFAISSPFY